MNKPKIILDYGVNAEGCIERAITACEIAHENKVDAIKFQHYNPKELGKPEHYKLTFDEYQMIANKCEALELEWGISLFNSTWNDAQKFADMGVGFFKVAAVQNDKNIYKKLKKISKGFNIIMSVDCNKDIDPCTQNSMLSSDLGNYNIQTLICNPIYPCFDPPFKSKYLNGLADMACDCIGYSCHTPMYHACLAAQMLGAPIIEKHFTLDHNQSDFRDHKHALDPHELKEWMRWVGYYANKGG